MSKEIDYGAVLADLVKRGALPADKLVGLAAAGPELSPVQLAEAAVTESLRSVAESALQELREKCAARRISIAQVKVWGPYQPPHSTSWRVVLGAGAARASTSCVTTRAEADELKQLMCELVKMPPALTIGQALERYRAHRVHLGIKASTERTTFGRLEGFFLEHMQMAVDRLSPVGAAELYRACQHRCAGRGGTAPSPATHRGALSEARRFYEWCVRTGLCERNPLRDVRAEGRVPRGKEQLRIEEARRLLEVATPLAETGDAGALAVMLCLLCGLRAGEVRELRVRDVDAGDVVVARGKTPAAARRIALPADLLRMLLRVCERRSGDERLLGKHAGNWANRQTHRLCQRAGVPLVTAQSLRGLHSTAALRAGVTARVVADALGHESPSTTLQSYAAPGAAEAGARMELTRRLRKE